MSKQIQFKHSMLTRLLAILLFFTIWIIISLIYAYMFRSVNIKYHRIFGTAFSFFAVRLYLKWSRARNYSKNIDKYTTKLNSYKDFDRFDSEDFNDLFCGYHIVYHGNVKAVVKYKDHKFNIKWEDALRNLHKHEVVNTNQNGMDNNEIVTDFFRIRFKELHFSFDWEELELK
jgi:hypothetical protein